MIKIPNKRSYGCKPTVECICGDSGKDLTVYTGQKINFQNADGQRPVETVFAAMNLLLIENAILKLPKDGAILSF